MPNDPAERPPTIDARVAERWAARMPAAGQLSPWLHEEVGRRMEDRLQWIKSRPRHWLDWAPLAGGMEAHALVARRYPEAESYVVEPEPSRRAATEAALAAPWWSARRWKGEKPRFDAPPEAGVDLLWANMTLHMTADPQALISRWNRLIATDGFLMFSCLGPDTVRELRALYRRRGWPAAGHDFTDMHDWGDMLIGAGFAEPVMDMERIVLTWPTSDAALAELRTLGRNLHPARFGGLRGRGFKKALGDALSAEAMALPSDGTEEGKGGQGGQGGGRIALGFEIIYGHAFKPSPRVGLAPESAVSLADMRAMLQAGQRPGASGPGG